MTKKNTVKALHIQRKDRFGHLCHTLTKPKKDRASPDRDACHRKQGMTASFTYVVWPAPTDLMHWDKSVKYFMLRRVCS